MTRPSVPGTAPVTVNATQSDDGRLEDTLAGGAPLPRGNDKATPAAKPIQPRVDSDASHTQDEGRNTRYSRVSNIKELVTPVDAECCLVQIHGPELGKKYTLLDLEFSIGREEGNHIVVDLDNVSRRHARILRHQGRMFVQDLGSTNGTYLNDQEVMQPTLLRSGDLLKVGGAVFKFLTGDNVELQYHETIYTLTIQDGLTGINNRRYFLEHLEREMIRCHRYGRPLTLILFDIDFLTKINDVHGHLAGDYVLRELAQTLKRLMRKDQCFARYGGEEFAVIIPEDGGDRALLFAEKLRWCIEQKQFVFENQEIPVTISLGVAGLMPDMVEPLQFIKRADANLYKAKKTGRNRVVGAGASVSDAGPVASPPARIPRRPIGGLALVRRNLNRATPGPVLAFEVAGERDIIDILGSSGFESWLFELEQDVEKVIGLTTLLGSWRERYILAALDGGDTSTSAQDVINAVRIAWTSRPIPEAAKGRLTRALRTAFVARDEVVKLSERCLDHLAVQLLDDAGRATQQGARPEFTFPLAAPCALIAAQRTAFTRFKAIVDALESALRFVVALEIALLRESDEARVLGQASILLAPHTGRPLPLKTWESLAVQLAPLLELVPASPLVGMLRQLTRQYGERSGVAERVHWAVREQERLIGQGVTLSDDAYREQEGLFSKVLHDFLVMLGPLKHMSLVSVAEIESLDTDDEDIRYAFYSHQGIAEHFPIHHGSTEARLARDWCYLIAEDRGPLCLAPIVAARTCEECGRVEVFLAEGLWLGPKGVESSLRGVTSNHRASIRVPFDKRAQSFFAASTSTQAPAGAPPKTLPVAPAAPVDTAAAPHHVGPLPKSSQTVFIRTPALAPPSAVPSDISIPRSLREALGAGRVIPFVGAGASMAVMDSAHPGKRLFPSWESLLFTAAQRLEAENLKGDADAVRGALTKKTPNYLDAAQAAREGLGATWYKMLGELFDPPRHRAQESSLALARALWSLGSKLVVTTNYDRVLHWACPQWQDLRYWDVQAPDGLMKLMQSAIEHPTLWHLHGSIANSTGLILTPDGYSRLYPDGKDRALHYEAALSSLRYLLASHTLLFVGFSFDDTSFGDQLRWLEETFQGTGGPHYVLVREAERDRMRSRLKGLPLDMLTYAEHGEPLVNLVTSLASVQQSNAKSP